MKSLCLSLAVFTACSSGLCFAGCFVLAYLTPPKVDPLSEAISPVLARYNQERDSWANLPPGPAREALRRDWQERFAREVRAVYQEHGKTPPAWTVSDRSRR